MQKPGDKITPASFAVVPELIGRPLASPSRRATAMAIDLLLVGVLSHAGGFFFGVAAAFALWRASARTGLVGGRPRLRQFLRIAAAAVLFLVVASNWGFWTRPVQRMLAENNRPAATPADDDDDNQDQHGLMVSGGDGKGGKIAVSSLASFGDFVGLRRASSKQEADRIARRMVRRLKESGASAADVRAAGQGLAGDKDALPPIAAEALKEAIAAELPADSTAAPPTTTGDSLAATFVRAFRKGDTATLAQVRPRLGVALAADTLTALNGRVRDLEKKNNRLMTRTQADSAKLASGPAGLVDSVADAGDELVKILRKAGLGFGWLGLYFTGFVAMMKGQTPGKWAMRIRIVRLDGRPMGWWSALERFGGYAASVVTALSGFFQILWDKNRQAMHDKIAETVVIRV